MAPKTDLNIADGGKSGAGQAIGRPALGRYILEFVGWVVGLRALLAVIVAALGDPIHQMLAVTHFVLTSIAGVPTILFVLPVIVAFPMIAAMLVGARYGRNHGQVVLRDRLWPLIGWSFPANLTVQLAILVASFGIGSVAGLIRILVLGDPAGHGADTFLRFQAVYLMAQAFFGVWFGYFVMARILSWNMGTRT